MFADGPHIGTGTAPAPELPPKRYPVTEDEAKRLETTFRYHAPKNDQPLRYQEIRENAKNLAHLILTRTPPSRERSLALTKLEEVVFFANAAIARNE